jgi:replicative DNA helicase
LCNRLPAHKDYISSLTEAISTSAGHKHHAEIIKELADKRRFISLFSDTAEELYLPHTNLTEKLLRVDKALSNEFDSQITSDFIPFSEVIKSSFKKIEKASEIEGYITGLSTKFSDLDRMTAGLQPSDLIILAARPSMGKTALAINIAENIAQQDKTVGVHSIEMSKEQLGIRSMGSGARINAMSLRAGKLHDNQWGKVTEISNHLSGLPIFIDDSSAITCADIKFKCRKLKKNHGLDLLIIDYLQLIRSSGKSESKNIEIGEITRDLKAIAKEFQIPIICLSQLNRKCEERPNKRPHLSDLRESGSIEQDADIIMFIYRDEIYNPVTDANRNIAEINIAKHRNGPTGTLKLTFQKDITRFDDYISEDADPGYQWQHQKNMGFDD